MAEPVKVTATVTVRVPPPRPVEHIRVYGWPYRPTMPEKRDRY